MTSNPNPKLPVHNAANAGQPTPTGSSAHSPSVPISVYRELAAELQATRVMLDSLNAQNQRLSLQNQHLRQEIEKVVHSALHLQQIADSSLGFGWNEPPYTHPELRTDPRSPGQRPMRRTRPMPTVDVSAAFPEAEPEFSAFSDKVVTEQAEGHYRRRSPLERGSEVNGWWIALAICLIVISAFGAGFMIMRPLLIKR